jgi:hypothetical protein
VIEAKAIFLLPGSIALLAIPKRGLKVDILVRMGRLFIPLVSIIIHASLAFCRNLSSLTRNRPGFPLRFFCSLESHSPLESLSSSIELAWKA